MDMARFSPRMTNQKAFVCSSLMAEGSEARGFRSRSCKRLGTIAPEGWSSSSDSEDNKISRKENTAPNKKRLCLSIKGKYTVRFKPVSPKSVENLAAPNPPQKTQASTSWAMRNLNEWFKWHNSQPGVEQCPGEFLTLNCGGNTLNKWLQLYIAETRNKAGQPYPPN